MALPTILHTTHLECDRELPSQQCIDMAYGRLLAHASFLAPPCPQSVKRSKQNTDQQHVRPINLFECVFPPPHHLAWRTLIRQPSLYCDCDTRPKKAAQPRPTPCRLTSSRALICLQNPKGSEKQTAVSPPFFRRLPFRPCPDSAVWDLPIQLHGSHVATPCNHRSPWELGYVGPSCSRVTSCLGSAAP